MKFSRHLPLVVLSVLLLAAVLLAWLAPEGKLAWEQVAGPAARKAGLAGTVVFGLLLATYRWWGRELTAEATATMEIPKELRVPSWPVAMAAVVLLATMVRLPLAANSMWWDELWNVRFTVAGEFRPDPKAPHEEKFRPTSFKRAFWFYSKPANHPPATVLAKAAHETWKSVTKAPEGSFSELVLRLPGMVCGVLGIVLLANTLRRWGNPLAGILAGTSMALSPWLVRYGVDLRGYALVEMTAPLLLLATGEIMLGRTHWRWWGWLGFAWTLTMWAHALSVWLCLAVAIALLLHAFWLAPRQDRWKLCGRLAVTGAASAAVFLMLFLPCLAQIATWGNRNQDPHLLDASYLLETAQSVFLGQHGAAHLPNSWLVGMLVLSFVASIAGMGRLWQTRRPLGVLALCLVGTIVVAFVAVGLTGFYFYDRFIIGLGPVALWLMAWGMTRMYGGKWGRMVGLLAFAGFGAACYLPLQRLSELPLAPWRQVAQYLQRHGQRVNFYGIGHGREALQLYAPTMQEVDEDDPIALDARLREQQKSQPTTPIRLVLGNPELHKVHYPKIMNWLAEKKFRVVTSFFAVDGIRVDIYEWLP